MLRGAPSSTYVAALAACAALLRTRRRPESSASAPYTSWIQDNSPLAKHVDCREKGLSEDSRAVKGFQFGKSVLRSCLSCDGAL